MNIVLLMPFFAVTAIFSIILISAIASDAMDREEFKKTFVLYVLALILLYCAFFFFRTLGQLQ